VFRGSSVGFNVTAVNRCRIQYINNIVSIGRRWEDNIKMDLQEVGCGGMDWNELARDRDTCECGNEPSGSIKCGEFLHCLRTG